MVWYLIVGYAIRGGVEDTRLEAKAKDQGHRRKYSPKKKVFKKIFKQSQKKGLQKIIFRRFPLEENKKRSTQIYC